MVEYEDNVLIVHGSEEELRRYIAEVLEFNNIIVVRLTVLPEETDTSNVLAFDDDGDLLWEIQPAPEGDGSESYKGLNAKDDELLVSHWNKHRYRVDPETGSVESTGRRYK